MAMRLDNCVNCGGITNAGDSFCRTCGWSLAPADQASFTEPVQARRGRLGIGAKIWSLLCLVVNIAAGILLAIAISKIHQKNALPPVIVSMITAYIAALGFLILFIGRKEGYIIICSVTGICFLINLILLQNIPAAFLYLVNPVLTGLIIKGSWSRLNTPGKKPKSRLAALILAILPTGLLGIDRFYLGCIWTGFLKLFTLGGFLVWYVVDIVRIARGSMTDKYGRPLKV